MIGLWKQISIVLKEVQIKSSPVVLQGGDHLVEIFWLKYICYIKYFMIVHKGRIDEFEFAYWYTAVHSPHRQTTGLTPSFLPKAGAGSLAEHWLHAPPTHAALQTDTDLAGHFVRILGFGIQLTIKGWVLSVVRRSGSVLHVRLRSFVRSDQHFCLCWPACSSQVRTN